MICNKYMSHVRSPDRAVSNLCPICLTEKLDSLQKDLESIKATLSEVLYNQVEIKEGKK